MQLAESEEHRPASGLTRRPVLTFESSQEEEVRDKEFISEVQSRAGLSARDDAERATWATLAILGERLPDSVAGPVAAALPERLGEQVWGQRVRSRVTTAQAGRLSRGVARGEGSWPGDNTVADADIDGLPQQRRRHAPDSNQ